MWLFPGLQEKLHTAYMADDKTYILYSYIWNLFIAVYFSLPLSSVFSFLYVILSSQSVTLVHTILPFPVKVIQTGFCTTEQCSGEAEVHFSGKLGKLFVKSMHDKV